MKKNSTAELLKTIRNRKLRTSEFRSAAEKIPELLLEKLAVLLRERGIRTEDIMTVIVLRAALSMLPAAIHAFPSAPAGVLGIRRDEETKRAHWYYEKLPPISKRSVIVLLDPMLATGGTASTAAARLLLRGANPKNIYYVGVIGVSEGIMRLSKVIPEDNIVLAVVDEGLDKNAMIVPGLGDYGDRYFGNTPSSYIKN